MKKPSCSWLVAATAALLLNVTTLPSIAAEEVVDSCFCQPSSYVFTLDFGLECSDADITQETPGIEEALCNVSPNSTDPFPEVVTNILITELDEVGNPIGGLNLTGTYIDGDSVQFASVLSEAVTPTSVGGLVVSIAGQNAAGEVLTNSWAIIFSTSCDVYPILVAGDQIGWTVLVCNGLVGIVNAAFYSDIDLIIVVFACFRFRAL